MRLVSPRRRSQGGRLSSGEKWVLVVVAIVLVLLAANRTSEHVAPERPGPSGAGAVVAPVPGGRVSSGFGSRWGSKHYGVDVAAPMGTPIRAVSDGTVIEAGPATGFGLWIRLRHTADGTVSVYGHMNTITTRTSARVQAGQPIATVGQRGQSTGPHLHLEIWPDGRRAERVDPARWFAQHNAPLTTGSTR